jgi:ABC-type multidrug transport system ATPase subunit
MPPAIHTEQLTKDFIAGFWRTERRRALDGLTLEIGPGEVFGSLGANGAGKTTTLKLLLHTSMTSASSTTGGCATTRRRHTGSSGQARCRVRLSGCGRWPR